jgi:hypothetical protein
MTTLSLFGPDVVARTTPDVLAVAEAVRFATPAGAIMCASGLYRYRLWRVWGDPTMRCCFLMLNPSTATGVRADGKPDNDATIRRCIGFAKAWGYGALDVVNLFAWRSTDPKVLARQPVVTMPRGAAGEVPRASIDYVGRENDAHIREAVEGAELVVFACGAVPDALRPRFQAVLDLVASIAWTKLRVFGFTSMGFPKHPVRLANDSKLYPWEAA